MARPRSDVPFSDDPRLRRLERFTHVLDNAIRIPGIGYRIGLDSIVGLIPTVGDVAGLGFSSYIVMEAARAGVPRSTLLRMLANVAIDAVIGSVPLIGDLFDFGWKANTKNMALLRAHYHPGAVKHPASNRAFFLLLALVLVLIVGLGIFLTAWLISALLNALGLDTSGLF